MFRYEYTPLLDELSDSSRRRFHRVYSKKKGVFLFGFTSIALLCVLAVIYFTQSNSPGISKIDQAEKGSGINSGSFLKLIHTTDCRKIKICSLCLDNGCTWTNSSRFPCRYDESDFDRLVVVPCGNFYNHSMTDENKKILDWNVILQLVSYFLGIMFICTRYYLRGNRRPYSGWEHPSVWYRPLERVTSGDIENVELVPLIQ